jgi:hypothetical protein
MNAERIEEIAQDIKALESAKFYLCNGWGIIGFRSDASYVAKRDGGIRRTDGCASGDAAISLINKLNAAIQPVFLAEVLKLQEELKGVVEI